MAGISHFSANIHAAPTAVQLVPTCPGALIVDFQGSPLVIFTGDADLARDLQAAMQGVIEKPRASPDAALMLEIVEALSWYASDAAWTMEQVEGSHGDYGARARATLTKIKGRL